MTAGGLRQVVRMIGFALAWIIAMIVLFPISMLICPWVYVPPAAAILLSLVALCWLAINLVEGIWRFTAREPGRHDARSSPRLRGFIRLMTVLTAAGTEITLSLLWHGWRDDTLILAGLLSLCCLQCCQVAMLLYLRRLATWMSTRKEARIALILVILSLGDIILLLVGVWGVAAALFAPLTAAVGGGAIFLCQAALLAGACLSALLLLAFAIVANRFYVMLDATAHGIPATDEPGMAAELAARTMFMGSS